MILYKFFYYRFFKALTISAGVSYSIFFLFSLFGNFAEEFSFLNILILSALNALQIFTYLPSFLIISATFLMIHSLRSKNELIIIKGYLKINTIILFFFPIILSFSIIESNKSTMTSILEKTKSYFTENNDYEERKLFIYKKDEKKQYVILKDIDFISKNINEYLSYEVLGKIITKAEFNYSIVNENDSLYSMSNIIYKNNNIISDNKKKLIISDFKKLENNNIFLENDNLKKMNLSEVNSFIFNVLFYMTIFLFFFNKKIINRNYSYLNLFNFSFLLFLYYLIFSNINLSENSIIFHVISTLTVLLIYFKIKINE